MTHPSTSETAGAGVSSELIDLTPDLRELSADDAQGVRGGVLLTVFSVGKVDVGGKSQKITDGTSNTITFSENVVQNG